MPVTDGPANCGSYAAAVAFFGRRPRRATCRPGMFEAHSPQRSASFAPRRASLQLRRIVAPWASSTSFPQLSQTRIVLRAMVVILSEIPRRTRRRLAPDEYGASGGG